MPNVSVKMFFRILWIQTSKDQYLFEIEIYHYVFSATFSQFNVSLLNKNLNKTTLPKILIGSVWRNLLGFLTVNYSGRESSTPLQIEPPPLQIKKTTS